MFQDAANRMISILQFSSAFLSTAMLLPGGTAFFADEKEKGVAVAPAGTDVFETSLEGT